MANKELTAKVRLETTQAEQKLKKLTKQINSINNAVNKTKASNLEKQLSRCGTQATKLRTKIGKVNSALNKTSTSANKVSTAIRKSVANANSISGKVRQWSNSQRQVTAQAKATNSQYQRTGSLLGTIGGKLRGLADTYLGVMGMKAIIGTSDMITSAENKLNYVSAQQLGASGTNADGSYSQATFNATQDAMDKIYVSSQKVRMGYGDMMTNVSKSMALAGDAFDNNIDKAIRFQEIMAEAYAVGGASQQEMASSMYQMIQALGAGTLAGDELRSVREGAPLAYKAIEEFAQGVYNTTDSLKDMASQGKITSDMVVAAIMNAGNEMDSAFAQTEQTFAQTWEQIKNVAMKAFEPVSKMIRTALNDAIDNGLVEKATVLFSAIAKGIMIAFAVIKKVIVWIADNWNWIKYIVGTALIVIGALLIKTAAIAIYTAIVTAAKWLWVNASLIRIAITIMALIYVFNQFKNGAISACEAITYALLIVAGAILLSGILMGSLPTIIIAAVIIMLAVIFMFFEELCRGAAMVAAYFINGCIAICNFICAIMAVIVAVFYNMVADIVNLTMGIWNVISAVCQNIGIAFSNAWNGALAAFWNFIADCIEGLDWLAKPLEKIAELFGKSFDYEGFTGSIRNKAKAYESKQQEYVSYSDAWSSGYNTMERINYSDAWNAGLSTVAYKDAGEWGNTAANWAAGIKGSINEKLSKYQNADGNSKKKTSLLDRIGETLGLDFSGFGLPNNAISNLLGGNGGSDDLDKLGKKVNDIADNTDAITDALDLTKEDLEYLRKVAEMEWKKEYTTANITVDMSNYNTINGESDLDSIVTKLADKLYEEMNIVANGVYAY